MIVFKMYQKIHVGITKSKQVLTARSLSKCARECALRLEGARPFPDLMPAFLALDRAGEGHLDRPKFALALRKVCTESNQELVPQ